MLKPWLLFCFKFERSDYFYLADLFMRQKKETCCETFLWSGYSMEKKTKRMFWLKIRTDLTSTLIVNHSFCDWCCCLKGFLSWLAFIFTCSILPGPCWVDPENKGVFVKFSILFTATWSSKFVWTPWSFLNSHATFGPLKFTQ